MKRVYIILQVFASLAASAQTQAYLDANNVKALILNRNDMFWDPAVGNQFYECPKGSGKHCSFLGSLWIGGIDESGLLHMAGMTYRQNGFDFWPGPLDTINAVTSNSVAAAFDKVWKINRQDIVDFTNAWYTGSVTAGTYTVPPAILTWPGNGNTNAGYAARLAPFVDKNNDGLYTPVTAGDHPVMKGDQMVYYIVNDNLTIHSETQGVPLGIEMHVTAYSYSCSEVVTNYPELDNTTFYHYKVVNRSAHTYTQTMAGIYNDTDIGLYSNDYIGCAPADRLGFAFNAISSDAVYGSAPPVVSFQVLRGPLADAGDGVDNNSDGTTDETGEETVFNTFMYYNNNISVHPPATTNPQLAIQYYGYMNAFWKDGSPLRAAEAGYFAGSNTVAVTTHAYPGDPLVQTGWTEFSKPNPAGDRRMIIGNGPFTFNPGESFELEYSILATFDSTSNGYRNIPLVKQQNTRIRTFFDVANKPACVGTGTTGIAGLPPETLVITPNPARTDFYVQTPGGRLQSDLTVYNCLGQEHQVVPSSDLAFPVSIDNWRPGVYILSAEVQGRRIIARLIKE